MKVMSTTVIRVSFFLIFSSAVVDNNRYHHRLSYRFRRLSYRFHRLSYRFRFLKNNFENIKFVPIDDKTMVT